MQQPSLLNQNAWTHRRGSAEPHKLSWQPSPAIAGPFLLAGVWSGAARSTAFPTPQGFKWGICHSTKNDGWEECYSAGRDRRQRATNSVAFVLPHGERTSRAAVPVPPPSHLAIPPPQ